MTMSLLAVPFAPAKTANRWLIALMGTMLQLALGTVYAWSYFQKPLVERYGWSNGQVAWAFSLAIAALGLAAACGGVALPKFGPRRLAMAGGILFGAGYLIAAAALHLGSLPLLYLGYGVIGGIGLGLGYVTPVATVAKWFPDKKGLVTGMVIMGFGFGALAMSKGIAPALVAATGGDYVWVFAWLGIGFLVVTVPVAWFLQNPPPGYVPPNWSDIPVAGPSAGTKDSCPAAATAAVVSMENPSRWRFAWSFTTIWCVFFCNILAGISIISFQSPIFQELWRSRNGSLSPETLASYGATLIAASSLFNGLGRMVWGGLSDRLGRVAVFRGMLASQIVAFAGLLATDRPWLFGLLVCYVLLCYGGGFGTMPALVLDVFGKRRMAVVYGAMLTAWSAAGVLGPQGVAWLKDHYEKDASRWAFSCGVGVLAVGFLCSLAMSSRPLAGEETS